MHKYEYTLDDNDYLEFNRYIFYKSPVQKKNMIWVRYGVAAISLLMLPFAARLFEDNLALWISYVVLVLLPVLWIVFFNRTLTWFIKRAMKSENINFNRKMRVNFIDNQIIEVTEAGESRTNYHNIEKIGVDKNAIYLFINEAQALIVPERVFENDDKKVQFMEFIKNKTGK
ncbi:MAG: YcxB family protein [Defluviitaleaceae bacterium]|nr:YcxB family protein [Defluviitaleaceae bacterium]